MPHALLVDDDLSFVLGLAEAVQREGFTSHRRDLAGGAGGAAPRQEPDVAPRRPAPARRHGPRLLQPAKAACRRA